MGKIYDLTQSQQELDDALFWEEEGSEKAEAILKQIRENERSAERMVAFLATLYDEKRSKLEAMREAKKRIMATWDRRIKKEENKQDWYKTNIADLMKTFDIKKVEGELQDVTLLADSESVDFNDNFSVNDLPSVLRRETVKIDPDKKAILTLLKEGEFVKGCYIVTKPSIRVV